MTSDTYLERVARCRIPGRVTTLKKRLAAIRLEAKAIREELMRIERVAKALEPTGGRS